MFDLGVNARVRNATVIEARGCTFGGRRVIALLIAWAYRIALGCFRLASTPLRASKSLQSPTRRKHLYHGTYIRPLFRIPVATLPGAVTETTLQISNEGCTDRAMSTTRIVTFRAT